MIDEGTGNVPDHVSLREALPSDGQVLQAGRRALRLPHSRRRAICARVHERIAFSLTLSSFSFLPLKRQQASALVIWHLHGKFTL
jgi:hypothetical protein